MELKLNKVVIFVCLCFGILPKNGNSQVIKNNLVLTSIHDSMVSILLPLDHIPDVTILVNRINLPPLKDVTEKSNNYSITKKGDVLIKLKLDTTQFYLKDSITFKNDLGQEKRLYFEFICHSGSIAVKTFDEFRVEHKKYILNNDKTMKWYHIVGTNVFILLDGKRELRFGVGGSYVVK